MELRSTIPWLLAAFLLQVIHALDLSSLLAPKGRLGIRLDYEAANNVQHPEEKPKGPLDSDGDDDHDIPDSYYPIVFSSHLTFNKPVAEIGDGELMKIAQDAYVEMKLDFEQYKPNAGPHKKFDDIKDSMPAAMGFLAIGNEIYLSSSSRGFGSLIPRFTKTPVSEILRNCKMFHMENTNRKQKYLNLLDKSQAQGEDEDGLDLETKASILSHRTRASCVELNVVQHYYQTHPDAKKYGGAFRMGTINRQTPSKKKKTYPEDDMTKDENGNLLHFKIVPECGEMRKWLRSDKQAKWVSGFYEVCHFTWKLTSACRKLRDATSLSTRCKSIWARPRI